MKAKHIIAIHFFLAIVAICYLANANCVKNANRWYEYYESKGIDARIYRGWYNGNKHRWCEYWNGTQWVMAPDMIRYHNEGYPRSSYDGYKVRYLLKD